MSERKNCGNCRFAKNFPFPGPAPVKPEMPTGFWARLFFDHDRAYWEWEFTEARHKDRVSNHENLVKCRRFPDAVTKRKTDVCGEFGR